MSSNTTLTLAHYTCCCLVSSNTTLTLAHYTCCCLTLARVRAYQPHAHCAMHPRTRTHMRPGQEIHPQNTNINTNTCFAHLVQGLVDRSTGTAQRLLIPTSQPDAGTPRREHHGQQHAPQHSSRRTKTNTALPSKTQPQSPLDRGGGRTSLDSSSSKPMATRLSSAVVDCCVDMLDDANKSCQVVTPRSST